MSGGTTTTEKGRFAAITASGERREIVEFQHWRTFEGLDGQSEKVAASTELFTDNGHDVNDNRDGTYTVLQTDEVLRRVDEA